MIISGTVAAILAAIAASAAIGNTAGAIASNHTNGVDDITKKRVNNTLGNIGTFGVRSGDTGVNSSELGKWFRETYGDKLDADTLKYIENLGDSSLGSIISDNYYNRTGSDMWGADYTLDTENLLKDIQAMSNVEAGPLLADYLGDYKTEAEKAINAENAEILKLYDDNLARQTANYNAEMDNLNNIYNDYAKRVLSNDYQKNAALLGTYQSEMSRARQNALESGANAGLRIAGNINTLLSAQNKQAATSLETSNQLAQAMMNQRNAAAGIRSNYNSMLDRDTSNRAALKQGTFERIKSAQSNLYDERYRDWNTANQINTEKNGNYAENPWYNSTLAYKKSNQANQANNY